MQLRHWLQVLLSVVAPENSHRVGLGRAKRVDNLEQSYIPGQQLFRAFSATVGTPFWYCIIKNGG